MDRLTGPGGSAKRPDESTPPREQSRKKEAKTDPEEPAPRKPAPSRVDDMPWWILNKEMHDSGMGKLGKENRDPVLIDWTPENL